VGKEEEAPKAPTPAPQAAAATNDIAPLLKRIEIFLGNEDWSSASEYCEKVLDKDPENGNAYVYKLLAYCKVSTVDDLNKLGYVFDHKNEYKNAVRYADEATSQQIIEASKLIHKRISEANERERKRSELTVSKETVEDRLQALLKNKQDLEKDLEYAKTPFKKSYSKLAIASLICWGIVVISILGISALSSLLSIAYITFIILVSILRYNNVDSVLGFAFWNFVLLGIPGVIYCIRELIDDASYNKYHSQEHSHDTINSIQTQLNSVNASIDESRNALRNINNALNSL
jgi:tetratricopeptide (TPR) repeat protein